MRPRREAKKKKKKHHFLIKFVFLFAPVDKNAPKKYGTWVKRVFLTCFSKKKHKMCMGPRREAKK